MKILNSIQEMKAWSRKAQDNGKTIGFVPTMGYLHEGHFSLVRKSLSTCDSTVASIFINPEQFGPGEDLDAYPVDMEADRKSLESLGIDVLFYPGRREIYPPGYKTYVRVENITTRLCGKSRPGFFQGVTTVVLKLFNIIQPHTAFFGEKDWQQLTVIKTMVRDLDMDISIVGMPIVRDADGLAVSSRNKYLNAEERESALSLSRALGKARDSIVNGERSSGRIRTEITKIVEKEKANRVDYISLCDPENFEEKEKAQGKTLIALAVHVGNARLIDNCLVES